MPKPGSLGKHKRRIENVKNEQTALVAQEKAQEPD